MGGGAAEQSLDAGKRETAVADVVVGEADRRDLGERAWLDYLIVVGLAHGLSYEEALATPVHYLELLDAYQASRTL